MADDMTTSGGSLHPGRPVIWPTGKPTSTSQTQQTSAQTQTQAAQQAAKAAQSPQEVAQIKAAAQAIERGQQSRQYTQADIAELLVSQNIADTETNRNMATLMLRYGVEISSSNFSMLSSMVGGDTSQTMLEAGVLLLMKGVNSPAAARTWASSWRRIRSLLRRSFP